MLKGKTPLLLVVLLGGTAVLLSYILVAQLHPEGVEVFWGGVPASLRSFYTFGMFLGALGYFLMLNFIHFRLDPTKTQVAVKYGYLIFSALFAAILVGSALWMPLTSFAILYTSPILFWLVRLDLWVVAVGSLGLLYALLRLEPSSPAWAHRLAVFGAALFCFQTVVLDAVVWVRHFSL